MNHNYLSRDELLNAQLSMLKAIHKCCVENNLTYYMAYGTLLGAVRHKGFIPWDDDVDIMMPLDDYFKFKKLFVSDIYSVIDCFSDYRHKLPFPRLYDNRTCRNGDSNILGVFVDIYIIHGAPKSQYEMAKLAMSILKTTKISLWFDKWHDRFARHMPIPIFNKYRSSIVNYYNKKVFNILASHPYNGSKRVYAFGGDGLTEFFWAYCLGKPLLMQFEDADFFVPVRYHDILTNVYGDYMQLPPEEERHPYHGSHTFTWK